MITPVILIALFFVIKMCANQNFEDKKSAILLYGFVILLATISAFRSPFTADYDNYEMFYSDGVERFEKGFVLLGDICHLLSFDLITFLFICALLSVSIKMIAIKKMSPFLSASMLIYITNIFILHDCIQIRCAIASGLILLSLHYLVERDIVRFSALILLAIAFHYTAIIAILFWCLSTDTKGIKYYICLIPIAYCLYFIGVGLARFIQLIPIPQIQTMWQYYDNFMSMGIGHNNINVLNVVQIVKCTSCIFLLVKIKTYASLNKYVVICGKIYSLSLFVYVTFFDMPVVADRMSELLTIVEVIFLPCFLYVFNDRKIGYAVLIFIASLRFYVHTSLTNHLL